MANPAVALTGIVGDTIVLKSAQVDAYGVTSSTAVVWSSSDATIGLVQNIVGTNNGVVTCMAAGTATITATMGVVTATFALTVIVAGASSGAKLAVSADQSYQPVNKTIQTKTS